MLSLGHCSASNVGLSTSFLSSTSSKNFCILYCQTWPIVDYNRLKYPKLADYTLPHKLDNNLIFDGGKGFSFDPFAEIVGVYQ